MERIAELFNVSVPTRGLFNLTATSAKGVSCKIYADSFRPHQGII
ncbi:hypothetical protein HMPREF1865_01360 [Veillonella parvula]|nr:hypothetical protein HMPREF1865_01360 [Veillonella parvula]